MNAALQGLALVASRSLEGIDDLPAPGGCELLREIGRGATAVVWLAREPKLDRLVALKLLSTPDPRLRHRLIREGQAAARLRHPHIVAVHALGETKDQAFLAMDFLEGGDLRQRLAREQLGPIAAAELGQKLAAALAHAHANGVLHRDVKPSNVLLDARGEPHLADFGLAAPLEGGGDLTLPGQVAGTAAYLAPELLAGADGATPRSDVYGLGALLYECLTGRAPFIGESSAAIFAQLARDDPPAPRILGTGIPRDLETICLKCLDKNPARRYASAEALQEELGRFLRGEPIAARPISALGKIARWCRRNPVAATFATAAALLLLCLAIGGPIVALRLAHANAQSAAEAAATRAVSDFLRIDLLAQASPEQSPDRDLKLRTVLDRAARSIGGRFAPQPLVEADIRETLATTYVSLGEYAAAREQWARVRGLRTHWLGAEDPKTLRASVGLIEMLRHLGNFALAEKFARELLQAHRRVLGPEHPDTLSSLNTLGLLLIKTAKFAEAEEVFTQLLTLRRRVSGPQHPDTLAAMHNLASVYLNRGKHEEGARLSHEVLALVRDAFGADHPNTLMTLNSLAQMYYGFGRPTEAERFCREALEGRRRVLGPDHPETLVSLVTLAKIFSSQGKLDRSTELNREILELQRRKLGAEHPDVVITMNNLACDLRDAGRFEEAERMHTDALQLFRRVFGPEHPFALNSANKLVGVYCDEGRLEEAERLGRQTLAVCEHRLGPAHPYTVQASHLVGLALLRQNSFAAAESPLRRAVDAYATMKLPAWRLALARSHLGETLVHLKRYAEAEPLLVASNEVFQHDAALVPPANQADIHATAATLSRLRTEANQPERAPAGPRAEKR